MPARTKKEIEREVTALNALHTVGFHRARTAKAIELAILELQLGSNFTDTEFQALPELLQGRVRIARLWKNGHTNTRPSEGWGKIVKQPNKKKPCSPANSPTNSRKK